MSTEDTDIQRYNRAAHAMQTGVAFEHQHGSQDGSAKHLRVGVNSAQVGLAAIAALLIEKEVFTLEEYTASLANEMEAEAKRYEDRAPDGISFL